MKKLAVIAMAVSVLGSVAMAGPLKTARVAGEAKWVAHVDVEAAIASDVGQFVLGEVKRKPGFALGMLAFRKIVGFDPLKDVRGVTAYGKDFTGKSGVAVIDATVDAEDLLDLARISKSYKELKSGKHVLHQWTVRKHGRTITPVACFYDKDTVILATSVELLQNAIDVLAGKARSMAKTHLLKGLPPPAHGSLMVAAAEGFPLPKKGPAAVLFHDVTAAAVQVCEANGKMSLRMTLTTKTADNAESLRQIAQGLVAAVKLARQSEQGKMLRVLGGEVSVSGKGTTASLEASMPTASIINALKHAAAMAKGKLRLHIGGHIRRHGRDRDKDHHKAKEPSH